MSNSGKSFIAAALCRFFKQDGYSVAPFKSQAMQAEAAGIEPSVLMNPILLKPTTDVGSQVIVNGEVMGNMKAVDYFRHKKDLIPDIMKAYNELASQHDIIVIEGAGSPAEINLKRDDIVNKFRGDKSIFSDGVKMLEERGNKPVVGVVPYINCDIEDEDSLSEKLRNGEKGLVNIAVIRLPRISNFTDFDVFSQYDGVSVRYVTKPQELPDADMIIVPGTKSTISDMKWLRESGIEAMVKKCASNGVPVFGICGGYQMLGETITDSVGAEGGGSISGMGFLKLKTDFSNEKTRSRTEGRFAEVSGAFAKLSGAKFYGYEIHNGRTISEGTPPLSCENTDLGAQNGSVYGCYIHGIFDSAEVSECIVKTLFERKGLTYGGGKTDRKYYKEMQFDILAKNVRNNLDMELVYKILDKGI